MNESSLEIINLKASVENKIILDNVNLKFKKNETHVILGPNGAGKSTLANVLMGNPSCKIISGRIILNGENITSFSADKRAQSGIFMSHQHPVEIDGITMFNFLRASYNCIKNKNLEVGSFLEILKKKMDELSFDPKFRTRAINKGFSGGEKKKSEILQMLLIEPDFAILDEIDSGLDIDGLKMIATYLNKIKEKTTLIIITHNIKIADFIKPDYVHVLVCGKIVESGNKEIIKKIESNGFKNF